MKSRFLCIIGVVIFLLPFSSLKSQSTGYSFHVGPNLGFQKWGYGSSRAALLAYHFSLSVDSESSEGNNIIYGDFGYHVKGGALEIGRASTKAVVVSCILILLADYILAALLL